MESAKVKEPIDTCPFDPVHQILRSRMQTHLVKCARNFSDMKMVQCMYNSTHIVPEPALKYHQDHCADRINLDKFALRTTETEDKFPIPKLDVPTTSESWDDDVTPSYAPNAYCEQNSILRTVNVQSQAKRRQFRMEERQRMQRVQSEDERRAKISEDVPAPPQQKPLHPQTSAVAATVEVPPEDVQEKITEYMTGINDGADVVIDPPPVPESPMSSEDDWNATGDWSTVRSRGRGRPGLGQGRGRSASNRN